MIWYRIRRRLEKAGKAAGNRLHGSFLGRAGDALGRRMRSPVRSLKRVAGKAGDFLEDLTSFDFSRASHKLDRIGGKLGKGLKQSTAGRISRTLLLPLALMGRLLKRISRGAEAVITAETPSLVPEAVARKQSVWAKALRSWWVRHEMGAWLRASPAILAVSGWLFVLVVILIQSPANVEAKYTKWADDAQQMGNYPRARVASERLLQMQSTNQPANILRLAKSLAAMGFADEALALAAKVAAQDKGYGPARLFIADAIINNPGANSNALYMAEKHLLQAFQADPQSDEAQVLLGRYYYRIGDWEEAKWYLTHIFPRRNDVALTLSAIELNLRNEMAAVRWATAASAHFQAEAVEKPHEWQPRLMWAEAELIRGRYTNSLDILAEGIQATGAAPLRRVAGSIYADLVKRTYVLDPTNLVERLELVKQGLSQDSRNEFLLQQMVRLTYAQATADESRSFLRELSRSKQNRALINFYQGMEAFMRNDLNKARIFFDAAFVADTENAIIANNYAWTLAISEPPDPSRSLQLINDVIEKYPQAPVFRETRGQIYARMGQWTNAVTDFENALPYFKSNAVFHASLAKAYSQMGQAEKSAEHQRIAESLKAAAAAAQK